MTTSERRSGISENDSIRMLLTWTPLLWSSLKIIRPNKLLSAPLSLPHRRWPLATGIFSCQWLQGFIYLKKVIDPNLLKLFYPVSIFFLLIQTCGKVMNNFNLPSGQLTVLRLASSLSLTISWFICSLDLSVAFDTLAMEMCITASLQVGVTGHAMK